MPLVQLNWDPNKKQIRQFGAVFMGGFVLIGALKLFWPFERLIARNESFGFWMIGVGLVVGVIALTGSRVALPFYWLWLGIAFVMGNIMGRLILGLTYFLVFTPMRLIGSALGRDKLQLKKPHRDSYWSDVSLPKDPADYERQF